MQARTLDDCLNADDAMARLAAHAGRLQKLQRLFEESVPASLARVCRVANFKSGALIIHAENGAVATKLRQMVPSLGDGFRLKGEQVTEILIKVQPPDAALQHQGPSQAVVLGSGGRASLERLFESLPESALRESLRHFLRRG